MVSFFGEYLGIHVVGKGPRGQGKGMECGLIGWRGGRGGGLDGICFGYDGMRMID